MNVISHNPAKDQDKKCDPSGIHGQASTPDLLCLIWYQDDECDAENDVKFHASQVVVATMDTKAVKMIGCAQT